MKYYSNAEDSKIITVCVESNKFPIYKRELYDDLKLLQENANGLAKQIKMIPFAYQSRNKGKKDYSMCRILKNNMAKQFQQYSNSFVKCYVAHALAIPPVSRALALLSASLVDHLGEKDKKKYFHASMLDNESPRNKPISAFCPISR
ncbi:hypothetical protein T01_1889 [Trichinella spiralis]|uniref:Uncharacterized protein n=1 Tax=Trichinella spiralis TaxID=6334 RepID=A0A0V1BC42_TRISP|nr:hypothetical protein T01_1889 [Trichinella spiralis]